MGMDADLLAIGPFSPDIAGMLDYSAECYEGVKPGTKVVTTLFSCVTSDESNELAEALGIAPWDFGAHEIDIKNVNAKALTEFAESTAENELKDVQIFVTLASKGFIFFFRPNG